MTHDHILTHVGHPCQAHDTLTFKTFPSLFSLSNVLLTLLWQYVLQETYTLIMVERKEKEYSWLERNKDKRLHNASLAKHCMSRCALLINLCIYFWIYTIACVCMCLCRPIVICVVNQNIYK